MKRIAVILLTLALLLACVPTPEDEFVVNKADQQQMLELASRTDEPGAERQDVETAQQGNLPETVDLYERLGAPKTYQTSLSGTDGRLQVEVDAAVLLPEYELPIARVESRRFAKEDALAFADALFGPDAEYVETVTVELSEEESLYLWSKGYYARLIDRAQWAIEHWNEGGSILYDIDDSTPEDVQKKIDRLLVEQSYAPVKLPRVDRQNVTPDHMVATADDITYSELTIMTYPWDAGVLRVEYCRDSMHNPNVPTKQKLTNDIPQRDAEAAANALLEKLHLQGLVLGYAYPDEYDGEFNQHIPCWRLLYTQSVNGVAETLTNATESKQGDYSHRRDFEILQITVDADGVAGLRYLAPQTVTDILTERTNLLPFEKIADIFKRYILVYDNSLVDGTRDKTYWTYHITTVRLGLVNIPEENSEAGLLVPAWDFLGYWHIEGPYESVDVGTNGLKSFLTINAVDGSIIEREGEM